MDNRTGPQTTGQAHPQAAPTSAHTLHAWRGPVHMPPELADVALIDAAGITAAACISTSTWHDLVRKGEAPAPVLRAPRCTRWRLIDVREWLRARAERGSDLKAQEAVIRAAHAGAQAAREKRQSAKGA